MRLIAGLAAPPLNSSSSKAQRGRYMSPRSAGSRRRRERCAFGACGRIGWAGSGRAGHRQFGIDAYDRSMSLAWEQVIVDSADPEALGRWWATALDWVIVNDVPDDFEIRPTPDRTPGVLFGWVPEPKLTKNRLHLDLRPDNQQREVERLLDLGATRADVGQGDVSWVVLADPEGFAA